MASLSGSVSHASFGRCARRPRSSARSPSTNCNIHVTRIARDGHSTVQKLVARGRLSEAASRDAATALANAAPWSPSSWQTAPISERITDYGEQDGATCSVWRRKLVSSTMWPSCPASGAIVFPSLAKYACSSGLRVQPPFGQTRMCVMPEQFPSGHESSILAGQVPPEHWLSSATDQGACVHTANVAANQGTVVILIVHGGREGPVHGL